MRGGPAPLGVRAFFRAKRTDTRQTDRPHGRTGSGSGPGGCWEGPASSWSFSRRPARLGPPRQGAGRGHARGPGPPLGSLRGPLPPARGPSPLRARPSSSGGRSAAPPGGRWVPAGPPAVPAAGNRGAGSEPRGTAPVKVTTETTGTVAAETGAGTVGGGGFAGICLRPEPFRGRGRRSGGRPGPPREERGEAMPRSTPGRPRAVGGTRPPPGELRPRSCARGRPGEGCLVPRCGERGCFA